MYHIVFWKKHTNAMTDIFLVNKIDVDMLFTILKERDDIPKIKVIDVIYGTILREYTE